MKIIIKYLKNLFPVVFISIIAAGCDCIPDINTPKEVVPNEYANILFINAVTDASFYKVKSRYQDTIATVNYMDPGAKYFKLAAGLNNMIKLFDPAGDMIYAGQLDLKKNERFTFVASGSGNRIEAVLLNDDIGDFSPSNVYLRIIHASQDAPDIKIQGLNNFPVSGTIGYLESTDILTAYSGKSSIEFRDNSNDSLLYKIDSLDFQPGYLYDLVIGGDYQKSIPGLQVVPAKVKYE